MEPFDITKMTTDESIDLHLGNSIVEGFSKHSIDLAATQLIHSDRYLLIPGSIVLGMTQEYLSVPSDIVARVDGLSVWGRLGLMVHSDGFVQPGFQGHLILEFSNIGGLAVPLVQGMRVASVRLIPISEEPRQPEAEQSHPKAEEVQLHLEPIKKEIFSYLAKHPHHIYQITPRQFEELMAELLEELGYEVQLTPATKDGGRDIFAYFDTPAGKILMLVECKRYMPQHKVGVELIERFLWTINEKDKSSCGLYATTSFFTSGVYAIQKQYAWKLFLRDYEGLQEWFKEVGEFECSNDGRIWMPKGFKEGQMN